MNKSVDGLKIMSLLRCVEWGIERNRHDMKTGFAFPTG